jgi:hypothetical protein
MVVGWITIGTCNGDADISVEILGKGPRPGTAWVKALDGLQPFTKMSHGGPCQDNTAVVLLPNLRGVHLQQDGVGKQVEEFPETPVSDLVPDRYLPALNRHMPLEDWFLESAYEDRTFLE